MAQTKKKPSTGKSTSQARRKKRLTSSMLQQVSKKNPLHLLAIPLGMAPEVSTHETLETFGEEVDKWLGEDARLFVFQGQRHMLSEGPYHYLIASDGEKLPLFEMPDSADAVPSADGFVGEVFGDSDDDEEDEEVAEELPVSSTSEYPKVANVVDSEFEEEEDDEWEEG